MNRTGTTCAMLAITCILGMATGDTAQAEEPKTPFGPPAWVIEAWENGQRPARPQGPPPWVRARLDFAREMGLPGPPPEVIQAWESGEGFELPGPPDFVLDLLGF